MPYQIVEINLPPPVLGSKCFLLEEKGMFILERGPGLLRTIACTHAGCGSLVAIDGVPNEKGFFPEIPEGENILDLPTDPTKGAYPGRPFYRANPTVMGSWMLDAGFFHGLTILAAGGNDGIAAIASIVWMPYRARTPAPPAAAPDAGSNKGRSSPPQK